MIKRLFLVIAVCSAASSFAQEGTSSPYSFNGLGEIKFKGTEENRAMGGISIYADSIHHSLNNPAALGRLKLTSYAVGLNYSSINFKTAGDSESNDTGSLDYLSVAFPVTKKLGVGFGLLPFTSVGYRLSSDITREDTDADGNPITIVDQRDTFSGSGGLNKVFLAAGYALTKDLSLGVTVNYNFGNIENSNVRQIRNVERVTTDDYRSGLVGWDFRLAANFQKKINEKLFLASTLSYVPSSDLVSTNSRTLTTVSGLGNGGGDSQVVGLGNLEKTDLTLPSSFTFGAGIGNEKKWFVGAEFSKTNTSDFQDRFFIANTDVTYQDASRFSVGGFYIPKYNSFSSYWSRVVYRAGLRFEGTGLNIRGEDISDFGMSFGVGLPMRSFSNVNIGLEFGKRGTTNANLIQENYFNLRVSLSLNDKWFEKRKYN